MAGSYLVVSKKQKTMVLSFYLPLYQVGRKACEPTNGNDAADRDCRIDLEPDPVR